MRKNLTSMAVAAFASLLAVVLTVSYVEASDPPPAKMHSATASSLCASVKSGSGDKLCIVPGTGRTVWFKDCLNCPELVVVPAGDVNLGPGPGEPGLPFNGRLRVERPFAIGRFSVTFAEWDACVAARGCNAYTPSDEGWGRGNRPVINVNWSDARAYVRWLSRESGKTYRMPSEAEREYATRAGATTRYWWGDSIALDQANIDVPIPSRLRPQDSKDELTMVRHQTVPVDTFAANPWGLFNVHGNVWEWTADCLIDGAGPNLVSGRKKSTKACSPRISRGGSWLDYADEARSAARMGFSPDSRNRAQGFRVVRELP